MSVDPLREVTLTLCERCIGGEGGECHTPGCALYMNRAPDVPIVGLAEPPDSGTRLAVTQDDLIDRALVWFYDTYRDEFPSGGDAEDDANATREGVAAVVVALTQMTPCPYCEWAAPGFQRVNEAGDLQPCGCDRGFLDREHTSDDEVALLNDRLARGEDVMF